MFSAKVDHKNHLTHSELEEQPAAVVAGRCSPWSIWGCWAGAGLWGALAWQRLTTMCVSPLRDLLLGSATRQMGLEGFEVSADIAGRTWGKGRDWVEQWTGRSWRGQQRWEWSVGQQSKGVLRQATGWCKALHTRAGQADIQLVPFLLSSDQFAFFFFFFNSGNYIFQLSFYGNKLVRSLCVCAPDWF